MHVPVAMTPLGDRLSMGIDRSAVDFRRWIWVFLAVGVVLRCTRYFLCFPLWEDECFLSFNLIHRGYAELTSPLDYHQVAPVPFLWLQLTVTRLFGFNEYALRIVPFLCSLASLFLFHRLASRLLAGLPLLFAVAVFAVAYPNIRYAAEAKPYGCDTFIALALLYGALGLTEARSAARRLVILTLALPIAIGSSFPAVFTAGAVCVFGGWMSLKHGRRSIWVAWSAYTVGLVVSFVAWYLVSWQLQAGAEQQNMAACWRSTFPPFDSPLSLPAWFWWTHTSDMLSYPIGGGRGAATQTFLVCLVGLGVWLRTRRYAWLLLFLSPLVLNIGAAALHRYPYGGTMRFGIYAAPTFCLLAGVGAASIVAWCGRRRRRAGYVALSLILGFDLLVAAGTFGRDVLHPYKAESDERYRDFARWFWEQAPLTGEVACVQTDLGRHFLLQPSRQTSWNAMYLCNQQIYSRRHAIRATPRWERVGREWPLRCVYYYDSHHEGFHREDFRRWLSSMEQLYELDGEEEYAMPRHDKRGRSLVTIDYVYVFRFTPREPRTAHLAPYRRLHPPLRR